MQDYIDRDQLLKAVDTWHPIRNGLLDQLIEIIKSMPAAEPEGRKHMKKISDLGDCELLCQLAEEAAELSQAALKLRRAIDGTNPTPKTVEECVHNLIEEIADCRTAINYISVIPKEMDLIAEGIQYEKEQRWTKRLNETHTIEHVGYSDEQCGRNK